MELVKIANYIRQNASDNYKKNVGVLNSKSKISELSSPLMEYSTLRNEFAQGLINVIGNTILNRIATFENPLAKFKRSTTGLGIDTREIAKGLVSGMDFDFSTEGIAKMFKLYPQEYAECFHRLNRQRVFPITFSDKEMKLALQSWDDFEQFCNDLVTTLYESNYQEEYELMLELIRASIQNDGVKFVEISGAVDTATVATEFVKLTKNIVSSFGFRDASNSPYGAKHPNTKILPVCKKEDIALILPYTVKNEIKVDVLASAFNKDELTFNVDNVTEVDTLGYLRTGTAKAYKYYKIDALICDKNYFRVLDDPDNEVNGNDLPTARAYNRYLHVWQTLSTSPFFCVNAVGHEVQSADVPEGYFDSLVESGTTVSDH